MGQALACKGTKLVEERTTDTAQGEINMTEKQLKDLKHSQGFINLVAKLSYPSNTRWLRVTSRQGWRS